MLCVHSLLICVVQLQIYHVWWECQYDIDIHSSCRHTHTHDVIPHLIVNNKLLLNNVS